MRANDKQRELVKELIPEHGYNAKKIHSILKKEFPGEEASEKSVGRWLDKYKKDKQFIIDKHNHYSDIAHYASLIVSEIGVVIKSPKLPDRTYMIVGTGENVTDAQLGEIIDKTECAVSDKYNLYLRSDFESHLEHESPELKAHGLWRALADNPVDTIRILTELSTKKSFRGTCDICKDW